MSNVSNCSSAFEDFQKCTCRMIRQCFDCLLCARKRIHPISTFNQNHTNIIRLNGNKLIRVIHLKNVYVGNSNSLSLPLDISYCAGGNKRTFSLSDSDYSFTSWSKPIRLCNECRLSFRNLCQNTDNSEDQRNYLKEMNDASQYSLNKKNVSCLETFIDNFVKDVVNDAIRSVCNFEAQQISLKDSPKQRFNEVSEENVKCNMKNTELSVSGNRKMTADNKYSKLNKGLGSMKDPGVLQKNGFSDSKLYFSHTHCNFSECQTDQSNLEPYVYYNSSYSDAEEETNFELRNSEEKQQISKNRNFDICPHLKHKKPVLLFLHGVGCSADLWTHMLYYFGGDGYEVVAPDMLGHGYSSTPDSPSVYRFHNLLKDAMDIFDKFVGDMKCVIIGHAFGCSLAAALARCKPQQVSQLVLISGGGPTPLAPRRADFRPLAVSPWLQICLKPFLLCGLKREVLYVPCGKHIETADSINSGVPPYVLNHIARGQDWPEGDSAFHRRILMPTLLVHGMKDPYVTLVQECEMERTIPRSCLELIENAGHFAMLETPDKLCHMIQCFINWWNY